MNTPPIPATPAPATPTLLATKALSNLRVNLTPESGSNWDSLEEAYSRFDWLQQLLSALQDMTAEESTSWLSDAISGVAWELSCVQKRMRAVERMQPDRLTYEYPTKAGES